MARKRKRKQTMPHTVFIGPEHNRVCHKLVLVLIESRDSDGIPRQLRMLRDTDNVEIEEGMEFMTTYVPDFMLVSHDDEDNNDDEDSRNKGNDKRKGV